MALPNNQRLTTEDSAQLKRLNSIAEKLSHDEKMRKLISKGLRKGKAAKKRRIVFADESSESDREECSHDLVKEEAASDEEDDAKTNIEVYNFLIISHFYIKID